MCTVYHGTTDRRGQSYRNNRLVLPKFYCCIFPPLNWVLSNLPASWLTIYLGGHPEWRSKAATEVENLIECYSPESSPSSPAGSSSSLAAQLAFIPLEAWENETPVLDALIRETTRIAQPHTAMRRNIGPELYINNKIIPSGAYVIYPFSDIHLDPELYPDPWKFDPGRKEVTHVPYGYLGWGGGQLSFLHFLSCDRMSC